MYLLKWTFLNWYTFLFSFVGIFWVLINFNVMTYHRFVSITGRLIHDQTELQYVEVCNPI